MTSNQQTEGALDFLISKTFNLENVPVGRTDIRRIISVIKKDEPVTAEQLRVCVSRLKATVEGETPRYVREPAQQALDLIVEKYGEQEKAETRTAEG